MVLRKSRPAALEELFVGAIVPHLHLIWNSSTRVFAENCFGQFLPIHEIHEFRWQALNLVELRVADTKERLDPGRRRRSTRGRSAWTWYGRGYLRLIFAPSRTTGASLHQSRGWCPHGCNSSFIFTTARAATTLLHHRGVDVQPRITRIGHEGLASEV
jgi:hypothetical protein